MQVPESGASATGTPGSSSSAKPGQPAADGGNPNRTLTSLLGSAQEQQNGHESTVHSTEAMNGADLTSRPKQKLKKKATLSKAKNSTEPVKDGQKEGDGRENEAMESSNVSAQRHPAVGPDARPASTQDTSVMSTGYKRMHDEEPTTEHGGSSESKKVKTQESSADTVPVIEFEDISQEVEARLREKEAKRKRLTEKKRKRDAGEGDDVLIEAPAAVKEEGTALKRKRSKKEAETKGVEEAGKKSSNSPGVEEGNAQHRMADDATKVEPQGKDGEMKKEEEKDAEKTKKEKVERKPKKEKASKTKPADGDGQEDKGEKKVKKTKRQATEIQDEKKGGGDVLTATTGAAAAAAAIGGVDGAGVAAVPSTKDAEEGGALKKRRKNKAKGE